MENISDFLDSLSLYKSTRLLTKDEEGKLLKILNDNKNNKLLYFYTKYSMNISVPNFSIIFSTMSRENNIKPIVKLHNYFSSNYDDITCKNYIEGYLNLYKNLNKIPSYKDLEQYFSNNSDNLFKQFNENYYDNDLEKDIESLINYYKAKEILLKYNQGLVYKYANMYSSRYHIPLQDLANEGNLGLIKAIDKFDISYDNRFSTYAMWWIYQAIIRFVRCERNLIKIPSNTVDDVQDVLYKKSELENKLNRSITTQELANYCGKNIDDIYELLSYERKIVSFDNYLFACEGNSFEEILEDDTNVVENSIDDIHLREDILACVSSLTKKERNIVLSRYGIIDGKVKTNQELACKYNQSRQSISSTEQRAVKKLSKNEMVRKRLEPYKNRF